MYMAAQMSTSVQNITEVVALMLSALTPWAAIGVTVNEDSPEMEESVRVSKHKTFLQCPRVAHFVFICIFSSFIHLITRWQNPS